MSLIGNIGVFNPDIENWATYKERLEQFLAANDVTAEKHVAVLLSVIGGRAYELLRSLTAPVKPADKTFEELCDTLDRHLAPQPLVIAERFRFHRRNQNAGESVAEFCVAIQKLSEHCRFGTTLNDALRDRLVCGLVNEHIQRKLLVEADLTYDRAKAIAIAAEMAVKDAVELRHQPAAAVAADVNKLKYTAPKPTSSQQCTRCGKRNHSSSECYFRDNVCHNCANKGHTKRMCKTKSKPQKSYKKKSMNFVGERVRE